MGTPAGALVVRLQAGMAISLADWRVSMSDLGIVFWDSLDARSNH